MVKLSEKFALQKSDILGIYKSGFKEEKDFSVGIEYERLVVSNSSYKCVDYWSENGIKQILQEFAQEETWDYIEENKNIIGLKNFHDTITLEPGAQIEISTKPEKNIFEVKNKIDYINAGFNRILEKYNYSFLNYGVSPYSTHKSINLIPKKRYKIMARYLWGILSDVMMRETAGIQCCIDFSDEEDAMKKFKLANKLSPFMTALFTNSPIRGGVDTGYKSFRALSWLNTDNDRCGFCGKISEEFSFEDYIDCVMKTPMIFITRDDNFIDVNGNITFEEFVTNGYEGLQATLDDYLLQANLYFPEVRMKNFIEIRNHDCVGSGLEYAILAIYKGLMYNKNSMDEVEALFAHLQYKDFCEIRYNVPKQGLETKVKKYQIFDYVKEIISIANNSLKLANNGEEIFLEPVLSLISDKTTPADIIIKNWNGVWNRDLRKFMQYLMCE